LIKQIERTLRNGVAASVVRSLLNPSYGFAVSASPCSS
jgi:hypothetical protein